MKGKLEVCLTYGETESYLISGKLAVTSTYVICEYHKFISTEDVLKYVSKR